MNDRNESTRLSVAAAPGPRFCPRCGRVGADGAGEALCSECGEGLRPQGYCRVCEGYWPRAAGEACPKHEIPLDESAPMRLDQSERSELVTVGTFADALAAEAPRIRLESEGIPSFLQGERMGSQSMYQVATGGVKLQVPRDLAAEARVLLAQTWELPGADEEGLDDAWDELAPEPGARRRAVMRGLIVFFLLAPVVMVVLSWVFEALGRG